MSIEEMVVRLATRGLLPCEHNLVLWQCADGEQWGAAIASPYEQYNAEALAPTLHGALELLMQALNRAADLKREGR